MAKQAVVRVVRSMNLSCDKVGNVLLVKFSHTSGKDASVYMPAHVVFWLLDHFPVNQDPNLPAPLPLPEVYREDWDEANTPRVLTVQCTQFADAIRMELELDTKADMKLLLDRSNVELMRQFMQQYRSSLMDLGVF